MQRTGGRSGEHTTNAAHDHTHTRTNAPISCMTRCRTVNNTWFSTAVDGGSRINACTYVIMSAKRGGGGRQGSHNVLTRTRTRAHTQHPCKRNGDALELRANLQPSAWNAVMLTNVAAKHGSAARQSTNSFTAPRVRTKMSQPSRKYAKHVNASAAAWRTVASASPHTTHSCGTLPASRSASRPCSSSASLDNTSAALPRTPGDVECSRFVAATVTPPRMACIFFSWLLNSLRMRMSASHCSLSVVTSLRNTSASLSSPRRPYPIITSCAFTSGEKIAAWAWGKYGCLSASTSLQRHATTRNTTQQQPPNVTNQRKTKTRPKPGVVRVSVCVLWAFGGST